MSSTAITWIIVGAIVLVLLWTIMTYNGLVGLRQRVNQAFSDIDVQTKQRHDLIPNLVETVKAYAAHERGTLEAVVRARNAAMAAPEWGRRRTGGRRECAHWSAAAALCVERGLP